MMLSYFIKKKIEALAAESAGRSCHSLSLDAARSVLVMYDEVDHESLAPHLEVLREAGKKVSACVYLPSSNGKLNLDESNLLVRKKDLNAWGFPSDNLVQRILSLQADILIDVTRPESYAMQYIAIKHPCHFKVGVKYPGQEWYDLSLMVTDQDDTVYLFEQLLFYLRSTRAK